MPCTLQVVAAMGPPGGARNPVDPRFMSLFNIFEVQFPSSENLSTIYQVGRAANSSRRIPAGGLRRRRQGGVGTGLQTAFWSLLGLSRDVCSNMCGDTSYPPPLACVELFSKPCTEAPSSQHSIGAALAHRARVSLCKGRQLFDHKLVLLLVAHPQAILSTHLNKPQRCMLLCYCDKIVALPSLGQSAQLYPWLPILRLSCPRTSTSCPEKASESSLARS
eukprot:1158274-Pelagomonas_calceolata.AAC.38